MGVFRGKIMDGDRVVVDNVEGQLYSRKDPQGWTSWEGTFGVSKLIQSGSYTLALDDGREGTIILTNIDAPSGIVRFEGSTTLE